MKNLCLSLCWFLLAAFTTACAQPSTLNGIYIGAQLYNTPYNGMQIDNIVLYFRNDGTFGNKLNQADWRTAVAGSYKIAGSMVSLNFKNGDETKRYKLAANGNLESTAGIKYTLHKVKKATAIPAGSYRSKSASTSGGMGSGMPQVGAFSSNFLYFDGKGNFSADRESVVGVGGDAAGGTVGGKLGRNSKGSGTYKLGDGEITLTFGNGTSTRHSFFYSPPNEEDLVLLDGEFYFREDGKNKPVSTQRTATAGRSQLTDKSNASTAALPSPTDMLTKLRAQYGGANIDKLNTLRETSTLTGNLQAVVLTDIANNRVRAEIRQNGKLLLVKQLDGNDSWQWVRGSKKALTQEDKDELLLSLHQGIIGLHKKLNGSFQSATVTASGNDYVVTFYQNRNKVIYLVGRDNTMRGNAYSINGASPNISVYKNFTQKNGISYPATTESSDGQNKLTSNTTSLELNPVFKTDDWMVPM